MKLPIYSWTMTYAIKIDKNRNMIDHVVERLSLANLQQSNETEIAIRIVIWHIATIALGACKPTLEYMNFVASFGLGDYQKPVAVSSAMREAQNPTP